MALKSNCTAAPRTCLTPCSGSGSLAKTHQSDVIDVIECIFKMPDDAFEAFCRNAGFNAVVRNYYYWVKNPGVDAYKLSQAPLYFRMTIKASRIVGSPEYRKATTWPKSGVHPEHSVPVSRVVRELKTKRPAYLAGTLARIDLEDIVRTTEIILVTRTEQEQLDGALNNGKGGKGLSRNMPNSWKFGDCHLARIWQVTDEIVGVRNL